MTKVQVNINQVVRSAEQSFKETVFRFSNELTRVITEPRSWEGWDLRDIVDTGQLRSSQRVDFQSSTQAEISWNTEYAVYVHEGYTLRNGVTKQGRPWTKAAQSEFDIQQDFNDRLSKKL